MLKKIDHIGLIVRDADETARLFCELFGFAVVDRPPYEDPQAGFKSLFLTLGEIKIELINPTSADSALAKFLDKRGEGIHHVSLEVEDIERELDSLKARKVRLINEKADIVEKDKVAFIHPSAVKGVLVELLEKSKAAKNGG